MTRFAHAPDGSLLRGLIARVAAEAEEADKEAQKKQDVGSKFAAVMPVRKVG